MHRFYSIIFIAASVSLAACQVGNISDDGDLVGDTGNDTGPGIKPPDTKPIDEGDPIPLSLHINDESMVGETAVVSFGVVFPKGSVTSLETVVVTDAQGNELASNFRETLKWQANEPANATTRSAMVSLQISPTSNEPIPLQIIGGISRTLELDPALPQRPWIEKSEDDFPTPISEPPVYAAFSAAWLGSTGIRGYNFAFDHSDSKPWFDEFMLGAADTAINNVPASVTSLLDLLDNEPWLFDRTFTLFNIYMRSGDPKWLRHAHRSAKFYVTKLKDGFFELAPNNPDLKYSYGQSLLTDYMLTGDEGLVSFITDTADAGATWNENYFVSRNFFTERHQAYSLGTALSAYELTGDVSHKTRMDSIIKATFDLQGNPVDGGWPTDQCVLHTVESHEGANNQNPICSPWMSGLLAEIVWRYYLTTENDAALNFLAKLGEWTQKIGVRMDSDINLVVPWYLASSSFTFSDSGPYADWEHTCDVAALVARGAYAKQLLGQDWSSMSTTIDDLTLACEKNLDYWHRPSSSTKSEWRLQPGRKFNWIFGTAGDLPWLLAQLGK